MRSSSRLSIALMLTPALSVIALLFVGGLAIALAQSLGYFAPAGKTGFTLAHYSALWSDREFRAALALTLAIATTATLISAVAGLATALALRELAARRRCLNFLLQVPLRPLFHRCFKRLAETGVIMEEAGDESETVGNDPKTVQRAGV